MEPYKEIPHNGDIIPPNLPKRIVSFCPSITKMLVKLKKADNIVGVSAYFAKFLKGYKKPAVDSYTDVKYETLVNLGIFENGRQKEIRKLIAQRKWNDLVAVKHDRIFRNGVLTVPWPIQDP